MWRKRPRGPVVQKLDNAIHALNRYNVNTIIIIIIINNNYSPKWRWLVVEVASSGYTTVVYSRHHYRLNNRLSIFKAKKSFNAPNIMQMVQTQDYYEGN